MRRAIPASHSCSSSSWPSPPATRRRPAGLATVASLRQYPGYFHLQNVLVHGEFVEGPRVLLRGGDRDIPVHAERRQGDHRARGSARAADRRRTTRTRPIPRLTAYDGVRDPERWPRPGEELVLNVTGVAEAQLATTASVRGARAAAMAIRGPEGHGRRAVPRAQPVRRPAERAGEEPVRLRPAVGGCRCLGDRPAPARAGIRPVGRCARRYRALAAGDRDRCRRTAGW